MGSVDQNVPPKCRYYNAKDSNAYILTHVSILANINVSLLANSKVDMVNVFEGGGGEEVERYCVIIIFSINFFYFFRLSTFQKFYLAIKLTKV